MPSSSCSGPPRSTLFPYTTLFRSESGHRLRGGAGAPVGAQRNARRLPHDRWRRSEEHTSELQSLRHLVCRLLRAADPRDLHSFPTRRSSDLNPDIVYVAALGHLWGPNEMRGVYRTTDGGDRKSTRLNSSHLGISYAVFFVQRTPEIYTLSLHDALPI